MGAGKSLTLDEITNILKYSRQNMSATEIAQKLNRSLKAVSRVLKDPTNYRPKKTATDCVSAAELWAYSEVMAHAHADVENPLIYLQPRKRLLSVSNGTDDENSDNNDLLFFRLPKVNRQIRKDTRMSG